MTVKIFVFNLISVSNENSNPFILNEIHRNLPHWTDAADPGRWTVWFCVVCFQASELPEGPGPRRDYQFMKSDKSETPWQRLSRCLKMQVSGSWTSSSPGRHPLSSLWILISAIIWQVRHKHTHRGSQGVCLAPGPSAEPFRGGRQQTDERGVQ